MRTFAIYLVLCIIFYIILIMLIHKVTRNNEYLESDILETLASTKLLYLKICIEYRHFSRLILFLIMITPILNLVMFCMVLYLISPNRSELLLEYEKDNNILRIFKYGKLVYAILNNNLKSKAVFTVEAYNSLVDMDDENLKFYMSVLQVCLVKAIKDQNYSIIVSVIDGHLAFEKIDIRK